MNPNPARAPSAGYVRALRFRWLTPLYDALIRATMREDRFRGLLVAQLAPRPGQAILDLGCGTGSLAIRIKQACPEAEVLGIDGDPEVLAVARAKAARAGVDVDLRPGMLQDPPFAPGAFDAVTSSLVLHHLVREDKATALAAARRLLRPGGELHVADWGRPHGPGMRLAFLAVQLLDGFRSTADNVAGLLPALMEQAGFEDVAETHRERTVFGTLSLYRARAP